MLSEYCLFRCWYFDNLINLVHVYEVVSIIGWGCCIYVSRTQTVTSRLQTSTCLSCRVTWQRAPPVLFWLYSCSDHTIHFWCKITFLLIVLLESRRSLQNLSKSVFFIPWNIAWADTLFALFEKRKWKTCAHPPKVSFSYDVNNWCI